jgi:hypothetical protein
MYRMHIRLLLKLLQRRKNYVPKKKTSKTYIGEFLQKKVVSHLFPFKTVHISSRHILLFYILCDFVAGEAVAVDFTFVPRLLK